MSGPIRIEIYQPPYGQKSDGGERKPATSPVRPPSSLNQTVFAKYAPRLYLEYFRRGIARTFLYEFVDEVHGHRRRPGKELRPTLQQRLAPKPAYTALKSLIGLLKEPGASFVPGNLGRCPTRSTRPSGYDRTQYVRHVLMQRSNGEYLPRALPRDRRLPPT